MISVTSVTTTASKRGLRVASNAMNVNRGAGRTNGAVEALMEALFVHDVVLIAEATIYDHLFNWFVKAPRD